MPHKTQVVSIVRGGQSHSTSSGLSLHAAPDHDWQWYMYWWGSPPSSSLFMTNTHRYIQYTTFRMSSSYASLSLIVKNAITHIIFLIFMKILRSAPSAADGTCVMYLCANYCTGMTVRLDFDASLSKQLVKFGKNSQKSTKVKNRRETLMGFWRKQIIMSILAECRPLARHGWGEMRAKPMASLIPSAVCPCIKDKTCIDGWYNTTAWPSIKPPSIWSEVCLQRTPNLYENKSLTVRLLIRQSQTSADLSVNVWTWHALLFHKEIVWSWPGISQSEGTS
jgi:hypothetical protein